ncbi:MAG TPA: TetR/AcrR family transcriptional regulator [Mycobacteriales bacterium]|nr:TetR/AcrR family transcriptional regulator [Mycobacteriales bacterium]
MEVTGRPGRPRSEPARQAVLHAIDDLLVDVGYAAMTMKSIAERAGVGRQTLYRWWSTKAEILLEACVDDAAQELPTPPAPDPADDLLRYVKSLSGFLVEAPAGLAYRALIGEAQHDPEVRTLVQQADLLAPSADAVLDRVRPAAPSMPDAVLARAQLVGPVVTHILTTGRPLPGDQLQAHVTLLLHAWTPRR